MEVEEEVEEEEVEVSLWQTVQCSQTLQGCSERRTSDIRECKAQVFYQLFCLDGTSTFKSS